MKNKNLDRVQNSHLLRFGANALEQQRINGSGKIRTDISTPVPELSKRFVNSLQEEGAEKVALRDGDVEFWNYFSWMMAYSFPFDLMDFVSWGRIKIDSLQKIVSYKVSIFPLFVLCVLTSLLFSGFLFMGEALYFGFFILFTWMIYGFIWLRKSSQFNSFIKKVCSESNQVEIA